MAITPQDFLANKLSITSTVYNGFVDKTPAIQENLANVNAAIDLQAGLKGLVQSGLDPKANNSTGPAPKSAGSGGVFWAVAADVLVTGGVGTVLGKGVGALYGAYAATKGAVEHLGTQDFTKLGASGGFYSLDAAPLYQDVEGEWHPTTSNPIITQRASNVETPSLIQTTLNDRFDRKELEQSVSGKTVYEKQLLQMQGAMIAQLRDNGDNDMTGLNFEKPKNPAAFSAPKFG